MILLILIIAAVLRFITANQSLWLDEGIQVNNAVALDFKSLIFNYSLSDFHPPIYHIILKLWTMIAGSSEVAVRTPSIVFGIATVYATYLIAKKLFEEKTALIAATLLATSPLAIYYSQEARMYSLAALTAVLSVYFFISLLKNDKLVFWIGFIASTVFMLYSDYLPYFLLPVYVIYIVFNIKRISAYTRKAFLPAFIIIFFFLAPWLTLFPKQIQIGLSAAAASPAWAQVVGSPNIQNLLLVFVKFTIGRISHENNVVYALLFAPVAVFVLSLFALSFLRTSSLRSFLYYWFFGTILLAFAVSFFIPAFSYFRFIFVLPAFYMIIASAINTINWTPLVRTLLAAFIAINLICSFIYFSNPKFQRENWKDATAYVIANSDSQTITLFESNYTVGPFDYYNKGRIEAKGALDSFNPDAQKIKERVKALTEDKNRVFLFQYLSQITDPQGLIFKELSLLGFINTSTKDFSGVGFVYEFTR